MLPELPMHIEALFRKAATYPGCPELDTLRKAVAAALRNATPPAAGKGEG